MALPRLEAPVYTMTIPSTGKSVKFRPYNVKEEKAILIARETGSEKELIDSATALVETCIDGIDTRALTVFDFEYIFLMLRAKSAGEISELLIKCSNCGFDTEMQVNLENAYIEGEIKSSEEFTIKLSDTVGIELGYPKFSTAPSDGENIDRIMLTIARSIKTIYDENGIYSAKEYSDAELVEFLESLPSTAFQKVVTLFNESPTVAIDAKYRCIQCSHTDDVKLKGLDSFF